MAKLKNAGNVKLVTAMLGKERKEKEIEKCEGKQREVGKRGRKKGK